jgi:hypothetical protein
MGNQNHKMNFPIFLINIPSIFGYNLGKKYIKELYLLLFK